MGCAYVVMAHQDPAQLEHLGRLLTPAPVFLHVDGSLSNDAANELYDAVPEAHPVVRHDSKWGSWSIVETELEGFRAALRSSASHVVLISGQDLPLHGVDVIDDFFESRPGVSAIEPHAMPVAWLGDNGALNRVRYWHMAVHRRKLRSPVPRRMPRNFSPYFGQNWCVLSREAVCSILELHDRRRDLAGFYRHVWMPAESYVHSLFMMTEHRDHNLNANFWFARWTPNASHPAVLDERDLADLRRARCGPSDIGGPAPFKLFARKFSSSRSVALRAAVAEEFLSPALPVML